MNSGKTASALMLKYNFEERGLKALLVKPATDIRDGKNKIKSRCNLESECKLFENLNDEIISQYDVLIVDESQFLTRRYIDYLTKVVDKLKISVFCYGLRTDFKGEVFEGSKWLLGHADKIEEIKTTCWCGNKATHNARLDNQGNVTKIGDQIEIGGNEKYIALCRDHFIRGILSGIS